MMYTEYIEILRKMEAELPENECLSSVQIGNVIGQPRPELPMPKREDYQTDRQYRSAHYLRDGQHEAWRKMIDSFRQEHGLRG